MQPIRFEEIKDLPTYERVRPEMRKKIIELKRIRRIQLGESVSVVFENRRTVLFQLQEMLRAERIVEESAVRHEIDTYNEMLPKPRSLAGTLFIELTDPAKIREELEKFLGLERGEHVWFDLGEEGRCCAAFAERPSGDGQVASVHTVQFPFSREVAAAFRRLSKPVFLVIEHQHYQSKASVDGPSRRSLAEDLSED